MTCLKFLHTLVDPQVNRSLRSRLAIIRGYEVSGVYNAILDDSSDIKNDPDPTSQSLASLRVKLHCALRERQTSDNREVQSIRKLYGIDDTIDDDTLLVIHERLKAGIDDAFASSDPQRISGEWVMKLVTKLVGMSAETISRECGEQNTNKAGTKQVVGRLETARVLTHQTTLGFKDQGEEGEDIADTDHFNMDTPYNQLLVQLRLERRKRLNLLLRLVIRRAQETRQQSTCSSPQGSPVS